MTSCGKPRQKVYITDCGELEGDADLADFDGAEEEEDEQSDDDAGKDDASEGQENSASEPATTTTFETEDEQPN